jgi:hypothetical protein
MLRVYRERRAMCRLRSPTENECWWLDLALLQHVVDCDRALKLLLGTGARTNPGAEVEQLARCGDLDHVALVTIGVARRPALSQPNDAGTFSWFPVGSANDLDGS